MCTVAIGACRRNHQPALYQSLAVDAVEIALVDIVDLAVDSHRRLLSHPVTVGAKIGNVAGKGRRGGPIAILRGVLVVTVEA